MQGFIKITSIWEDESLFEVRISASNGKFSGEADCYTNRDQISNLGTSLIGFPTSLDSVVEFTTGETGKLSFFSLKFYCVDGSGHILVKVKICHNEGYSNKESEIFSTEFDLPIEPSQIDNFVNLIARVATEDLGSVCAEIREGKS